MYDHRVIYRIIISLTLDLGIKLPSHKYGFKIFSNLLFCWGGVFLGLLWLFLLIEQLKI